MGEGIEDLRMKIMGGRLQVAAILDMTDFSSRGEAFAHRETVQLGFHVPMLRSLVLAAGSKFDLHLLLTQCQ